MRTTRPAALSLALLLGAGGCSVGASASDEDCDAEDFMNREEDCGFKKSKHKTTVKIKRSARH